MTKDKDLKRLVRVRMAETGESYTAALLAVQGWQPSDGVVSPAGPPARPERPERGTSMRYRIEMKTNEEPVVIKAEGYEPPHPGNDFITFYRTIDDRKTAVYSVQQVFVKSVLLLDEE